MTTKLGRVTSVVPKPEEKRIYVSVKVSPSEYYEEIIFSSDMAGLWMVPTEGDIVEVYEVGFETYAARRAHSPPTATMPDMGEGDFCLRLNEGTELNFSKQDDGTINLDVSANGDISVSTVDGNISVESTNGDIVATAGGKAVVDSPSVLLGGETGTKVVAREGDSVETSDPLTGTNSGTITSGSGVTESQ